MHIDIIFIMHCVLRNKHEKPNPKFLAYVHFSHRLNWCILDASTSFVHGLHICVVRSSEQIKLKLEIFIRIHCLLRLGNQLLKNLTIYYCVHMRTNFQSQTEWNDNKTSTRFIENFCFSSLWFNLMSSFHFLLT